MKKLCTAFTALTLLLVSLFCLPVLATDITFDEDEATLQNGTLTITGDVALDQQIVIGQTTAQIGNDGPEQIIKVLVVNGTLTFYPKSDSGYSGFSNGAFTNYGTNYAIVYNNTKAPGSQTLSGSGTIQIGTGGTGTSQTLSGLVLVSGATGAGTTATNQSPVLTITGVTIDSTNSQQTIPSSARPVGTGIGVAGNAEVILGTNSSNGPSVTGFPAIFAAYGGDSEIATGSGQTEVTINSGTYTAVGESTNKGNLAAVRTTGNDKGKTVFSISGGEINGQDTAGIYAASNGTSTFNITGGTITGFSGISLRSGELNISGDASISGTGNGTAGDSTSTNSDPGNGAAIYINENASQYNESADIDISGGSFSSDYTSAVYAGTPDDGNKSPLEDGDIEISGGSFTSAENSPDLTFPTADKTGNKDVGAGCITGPASFSNTVQTNQLASGTNSVVVIDNADGTQSYVYFKGLAAAQEYSEEKNGSVYTINTSDQNGSATPAIPVPPGQTQVPSTPPQVYQMNLGSNLLNFYNSSGSGMAGQEQNVGLVVNNVPNGAEASCFNWAVTALNGSGTAPTFPNDTVSVPWPALSGVQGCSYMQSTDGHWQIRQYRQNGALSGVYLYYDGQGSNLGGVYQLTATAKESNYNQSIYTTAPSDSIRFLVENTNITSVRITDAPGSTSALSNIYTVNLSNGRTFTPGYIATSTNGANVPGQVVNWTLELVGGKTGDSYSNYALFNSQTGQITFTKALPTGLALQLGLSVDGVSAPNVEILTSGSFLPDEPTAIEPIYNPLYLYSGSGQYYNLKDNITFLPVGGDYDINNVTFSVDSSDVIFYNNMLYPVNSRFNGVVPVTATYTDGTTTLTTSFEVNYSSTQVNPTGVTAESALTFQTGDLTPQNVNARLTPTNTTYLYTPKSFTYTSSNESVAVVDGYGNVTAVGEGQATITSKWNSSTPTSLTGKEAVTTVTVSSTPSDIPATAITATPDTLFLAPEGTENATTTGEITVSLTPTDSTSTVTAASSADTVATVTETGENTYTVTAGEEGEATITFTAGEVSTTVKVIVSNDPVVAESVTASGDTPDEFTVTVSGVQANPALAQTGTVDHVSLFTWSGPLQNDMQCVRVTTPSTEGVYSYQPFRVNGDADHQWYYNADEIYVQAYGSLSSESEGDLLGLVSGNYSWMDSASAAGKNVAYITYQENNGFNTPTVFDGSVSGETGKHLQLEGLRVSSNIEGVEVETDVHIQDVGWQEAREDGSYAGTQHEYKQLEAIRLRLTGENAANYDIYYQVHAEDLGWMGATSNGNIAGTTGQNRQIEAVQIQIVPKGMTPTGWATN